MTIKNVDAPSPSRATSRVSSAVPTVIFSGSPSAQRNTLATAGSNRPVSTIRLKYSTAKVIMIATGATVTRPLPMSSPSRPPKPAAIAATMGSTVSASSTETRRDSTATRNSAMVRNPAAASIVDLRFGFPHSGVTAYGGQALNVDRLLRCAHGSVVAPAAGGRAGERRGQLHHRGRSTAAGAVLAEPDRAGGRTSPRGEAVRPHHPPAGSDSGRPRVRRHRPRHARHGRGEPAALRRISGRPARQGQDRHPALAGRDPAAHGDLDIPTAPPAGGAVHRGRARRRSARAGTWRNRRPRRHRRLRAGPATRRPGRDAGGRRSVLLHLSALAPLRRRGR